MDPRPVFRPPMSNPSLSNFWDKSKRTMSELGSGADIGSRLGEVCFTLQERTSSSSDARFVPTSNIIPQSSRMFSGRERLVGSRRRTVRYPRLPLSFQRLGRELWL